MKWRFNFEKKTTAEIWFKYEHIFNYKNVYFKFGHRYICTCIRKKCKSHHNHKSWVFVFKSQYPSVNSLWTRLVAHRNSCVRVEIYTYTDYFRSKKYWTEKGTCGSCITWKASLRKQNRVNVYGINSKTVQNVKDRFRFLFSLFFYNL